MSYVFYLILFLNYIAVYIGQFQWLISAEVLITQLVLCNLVHKIYVF
jgi:hypothetical protein